MNFMLVKDRFVHVYPDLNVYTFYLDMTGIFSKVLVLKIRPKKKISFNIYCKLRKCHYPNFYEYIIYTNYES